MPDDRNTRLIKEVQRDTSKVLDERARIRQRIAAANAEIAALDAKARELAAAGDREGAERIRTRITAVEIARGEALTGLRDTEGRIRDILDRFERIDPCDADPTIPLVLLPVRIETRFTPDRKTLKVRIFPDTIHIDQLDRGMTEEEVAAGRAFWMALADGEEKLGPAWEELVGAVGARRATWVATGMTPLNRAEWLAGAEPEFPKPGPRDRSAAIARLLPDRFVVVAQQGGNRSEARTNPVPPEVLTGVLSDDGSQLVEVGGARVPTGAEWMVDYDAAVKVGLAVDLPLKVAGPVDRLYVMGVRRSLTPERAAEEFTTLLASHRCSRGLGFVPQGSPTNNTDGERSEFSRENAPEPPAHLLSPDAPPADGNAATLARALGIPAEALDGIPHADLPEQARARAMNAALWPASWGTFLDRLSEPSGTSTRPAVSDSTEQAVRDFFRDNVYGRGPLPTLRVGDQPYGFLPASTGITSRWTTNAADRIDSLLLTILRNLRPWWERASESIPHLGNGGGQNIDETFLEILGMSPVSQAMRVRNIVSEDAKATASQIGVFEALGWQVEQEIAALLLESLGIDHRTVGSLGSRSHRSRGLPFPLVHASDPDYMQGLLDRQAPKVRSLLQAMLGLALDSARRDVDAAAPTDKVREMVEMVSVLDARQKATVLALAGDGGSRMDSTRIHQEADRIAAVARIEEEPGRQTLKQYQPLQALRTSYAELAADSSITDAKVELATLGTLAWMRAKARYAEVREAIAALRQTELRERAILFGEFLDLCSHRLDAWITGVVNRRLTELRSKKPAGLTIGAFGWVENIRPGAGTRPVGGYIHAPSLDQAATAGILRSAYLTHNADQNGDGAFAIDLSSQRVRAALHIVDGVQQGQPLGALLGYRIERALHEERLDRLILSLRRLAPLVARKLTDRSDNVPAPAAEAIAANNVVDGVRLIEMYNSGAQARAEIRQALNAPPEDNPYIEPGDWPPLTDVEWSKVQRIIEGADEVNDAAADLLLAESVHQLVRGNTARAAATLSAAGSGEVPPPDPEVIRTPAPGTAFSHRVMLVMDGSGEAWNPARPRAMAEPALEAWAAARLGDPAQVFVADGSGSEPLTLADTGLCALDVVYDSGDRRTLEQRVRAALPGLDPDVPLAERRDPAWPEGRLAFGEVAELAAALRSVLVTASPASPSDFSRAAETPARTITPESLAEAASRGEAARGLLSSTLEALEAAMSASGGGEPDLAAVGAALEAMAAFGAVVPAVPSDNLLAVAEVAAAEARRRIEQASELLDSPNFDAEDAAAVGAAIFGDGFWILPRIDPAPEGDLFAASWEALKPPRAEIRRFIRDVASVREPLARLSKALMLGDALNRPTPLSVSQLAVGDYPWVGGMLGADVPAPDEPVTNVVVQAPAGWDPNSATAGLIIDQWTDVIPELTPFAGETEDEQEIIERRSTGIAVNAASASARPPQAVLVAVSPNGSRWTTPMLVDLLDETLEMARIRTVTLEAAPGAGAFLPALYLPGWSVGSEPAFDIRYAAKNAYLDSLLAYVKEPS